jgi:hypothetical protein
MGDVSDGMGDEGEVMISAADPLPTTNAYAFLYFFHFILRPVQSCQSIDQVRRAPHTPSSWNHAWPNGVPENSEPFHWRRDSDNKMFRSDGCVCVCVLRVVCGFQNKFQKQTNTIYAWLLEIQITSPLHTCIWIL